MTDFLWPIRVYYEDTDAAGVVYYANYLKFMERARTEFVRTLGVEQNELREQQGIVFVVRDVSLQIQQPARFNDELEVVSVIEGIAKTHLVFNQEIFRKGQQIRLCHGRVQVVCLDIEKWKPCAIPSGLIETLQK